MKALFLLKPGTTEIREITQPTLSTEQVLIKVGMVGFCGGDLNAFRGKFPMQQYPIILGHEIGGVIEELRRRGIRDEIKVIIGGAALTQDFASDVGADAFAPDAVTGTDIIREWSAA